MQLFQPTYKLKTALCCRFFWPPIGPNLIHTLLLVLDLASIRRSYGLNLTGIRFLRPTAQRGTCGAGFGGLRKFIELSCGLRVRTQGRILKSVLIGYRGPKGYPKAHQQNRKQLRSGPLGFLRSCAMIIYDTATCCAMGCNVAGLTGTKRLQHNRRTDWSMVWVLTKLRLLVNLDATKPV